ncbi:EAL domain-containing protein [Vibrio navarrensis]
MFRFAISHDVLARWKQKITQASEFLDCDCYFYSFSYTEQWMLEFAMPIGSQSHLGVEIYAKLEQWQAEWPIGQTEAQYQTVNDQAIALSPVWLLDQQLFGVLIARCRKAQHAAPMAVQLSGLAAIFSFELANLYHQQQLRHQAAELTAIPKLQDFIDCLEDHTWIKSVDGKYLATNQSVEQAWQKSALEIVGQSDYELFPESRAKKFIESDELVVASGNQQVVEECYVFDDQQNKSWLETIKSPIRNRRGELIGILGMTRNITRRKHIETQLTLASRIFNNSQEGMVITDHNARILDVNQAFSSITGYSAEEVVGKNPSILRSGHHDDAFYQQLWQQLEQQGQWKGEFINRRKDGSIYPQLATISAVQDELHELVNYICVFEDISARKANEAKLERMAFYDPLTGLPNRTLLVKLLQQQIKSGEQSGLSFATLFLDIDHFKHINDSLGHLCGDTLLSQLGRRLSEALHGRAHISRIGGDEFVVLLPDLQNDEQLTQALSDILKVFNRPFHLSEQESLRVSTSIGIARFPQDGTNSESLLKNADTAMYLAKKNGRNGYAFYSPDLTNQSLSRLRYQSALHEALEKDQLFLLYQPQFNLYESRLVGMEALLRWQHPEWGLISPAEFIPVAEKTGLIQEIGLWVLRNACQQAATWLSQGYRFSHMAVNVSALQLQNPHFISELQDILQDTQLPARKLELEITEGFLLHDPVKAIQALNQLRAMGVEIALDDFGTGYSSLSYLKGLPISKLKIDRSFINDIPVDSDSNAIVKAVIAMGETLTLTVIAEGVENQQQVDYLISQGCLLGQGFYLARPQDAQQVAQLMVRE